MEHFIRISISPFFLLLLCVVSWYQIISVVNVVVDAVVGGVGGSISE